MRKPKNRPDAKQELEPSETKNDDCEHQPMSGNDMNVVSFTNKGSVKLQREEIVFRAYQCLDCHPHFRGRQLDIRIRNEESVLKLEGRLPSYYLKQILQTVLRQLDGVAGIQNDVEVFKPSDSLNGIEPLNQEGNDNVKDKNQNQNENQN